MTRQGKNGLFVKSVKEKGKIGNDVALVMVGHAGYVVVVCKNVNIAKEQGKGRFSIINKRWRYYC